MADDILVIGIAGGTGSGKTTLMNNIMERFSGMVTVLSHDNYYKRHDELTFEERSGLNYDEPDAIETSLMVEHLKQLRQGQSIDCPVYDFTRHNRSDETVRLEPRPVIIVEGILIFENEQLHMESSSNNVLALILTQSVAHGKYLSEFPSEKISMKKASFRPPLFMSFYNAPHQSEHARSYLQKRTQRH